MMCQEFLLKKRVYESNLNENKTIKMKIKEGYEAMIYFLTNWYAITKSDDIGEILSLMESLEDGKPADSIMWDYWEEAIEKVRKNGEPPIKVLHYANMKALRYTESIKTSTSTSLSEVYENKSNKNAI